MKKPVLLLFSIFLIITSCNKDDDTNSDNSPQFNELGLQLDVKPINQDTLAIYNPSAIEVVNAVTLINDFGTEYTLNVETDNLEKIKTGNVIVDYANGGRLWIIKEASSGTNKTGKTSKNKATNGTIGIKAILGSLDTFFKNAIVEVATPTNRAKNASSNPNKLESGKFKLYSGTAPLVTVDLPNISINEQSVADGVTLSVDNNTVNVNLSNVQLYSNNSNTFNVSIPEGSLEVNNAVDMRYKYLPLTVNIGSLQEFDSSIYTTIDTNIKLNIEATTNGAVNLIEPIEKKLGSYTKVIPVPPYFAASIKVSLKARLTVTASAQLNITPEISTKNNFEARASYKGLLSLPNIHPPVFQNIETNLANSVNGNFNLNQRLEIIPEVEVYAYGLLGPKGELITYEEFNANANIQNAPITWDSEIDLGVDYNTSLDVSIFHIDKLSSSIASKSGNIFNYDLFTSPNSANVTLGNNQTAEVNTTLTTPIEIEVKNSAGKTVAGVPVFFETTDGSFSSDYKTTDAGGVVTNNWTLGSSVGEQNASVYVKDGKGNIIQTTEIDLIATAENATTVSPVNTPIPTNSATDIALNGDLTFTESGNTPTDATFKVYFDTNANPSTAYNLDANINTLSYSNLQEGTPYYWKVETISSTGSVLTTSPIWSFTTLTNNSSNVQPAHTPSPNNNAINVAINGGLTWLGGAGTPPGRTFRIYFDTNPNPATTYNIIDGSQSFTYSSLQNNITYYWKVETISESGEVIATSEIWSFSTIEESTCVFNGDVILQTQQEVDDFGSQNYCEITGNLTIGRLFGNNSTTDITSISSLNSLEKIGGNILRIAFNQNLQSFENGLENLILSEINNDGLGVEIQIWNNSLTDFNGLSNSSVFSLSIKRNQNLNSLSGLENLNFKALIIEDNSSLVNFCSITNRINGNLNIYSVSGNSYNPTQQDIIEGNCSQ